MHWDIFCKVIDNHGDIGVCWRLSAQLAERGDDVRLWVDAASALAWMAPAGHDHVTVVRWTQGSLKSFEPGDVVVEAFGCELDDEVLRAMASHAPQPRWINLEYLTAERFAERNHGLASPVPTGPASGMAKHFFYPGFTPATGGLLRERTLLERQRQFDRDAWLRTHGVGRADDARVASLFCYEPAALASWLWQRASQADATALLVTHGRATAATRNAVSHLDATRPGWNAKGKLAVAFLPLLTQDGYDELLWACDLNFVRGEDSLVRALWAGKPFAWQLYPQDDDAHHAKLRAFLDWLDAPADVRRFFEAWNGARPDLPAPSLAGWAACMQRARARLLEQEDLASQLTRFVQEPRP